MTGHLSQDEPQNLASTRPESEPARTDSQERPSLASLTPAQLRERLDDLAKIIPSDNHRWLALLDEVERRAERAREAESRIPFSSYRAQHAATIAAEELLAEAKKHIEALNSAACGMTWPGLFERDTPEQRRAIAASDRAFYAARDWLTSHRLLPDATDASRIVSKLTDELIAAAEAIDSPEHDYDGPSQDRLRNALSALRAVRTIEGER